MCGLVEGGGREGGAYALPVDDAFWGAGGAGAEHYYEGVVEGELFED